MVLKADHRQDTHSHIEKGSMRYINATWPKLEEKRKQHIVRDRGQKKKENNCLFTLETTYKTYCQKCCVYYTANVDCVYKRRGGNVVNLPNGTKGTVLSLLFFFMFCFLTPH